MDKESPGPCRESAASQLTWLVKQRRKELEGFEALLEYAQKLEANSPAEEALHRLLCNLKW